MRQLFEAAVSWSYDSPAKGGLHHAHYPGRVANRMDLLKWTSRAAAPVFAIMLCGSNSARAAASQSQIPCAGGVFFQRIHVTLMVRNHNTGGNTMCKIRSIKQAADYFKQLDPETQITEYTLRKLIADGTIPSIKTGNKHLVNLDQVLSLFEPACVSTAE